MPQGTATSSTNPAHPVRATGAAPNSGGGWYLAVNALKYENKPVGLQ